MKFQRITKCLLLLALCLVMLWPQTALAAPSASLSGDSSIQAGSDVTLTLKVSGSNVMGVEATLNYDSSVLEYRSYSGKLSGWDVVPNGTKFVMYGVGNPINSSTSVVSVTFRVKSGLSADTALAPPSATSWCLTVTATAMWALPLGPGWWEKPPAITAPSLPSPAATPPSPLSSALPTPLTPPPFPMM